MPVFSYKIREIVIEALLFSVYRFGHGVPDVR